MNKAHFYLIVFVLLLITAVSIIGCGSNSTGGGGGAGVSNRAGIYSYSGTQSPGDAWTWTISTTEFSGSNEATGMWVTGEWTALSSGFGKATIISSNYAPAINGHAYFLEVPNTMLLVKPDDNSDSRVMVCAASTTLEPTSPGTYLFVNIPKHNWQLSDPAYGTVEATKNGSNKWNFDLILNT
jgi:hypothetical protein